MNLTQHIKKPNIFLIAIICIALVLRFWQLGNIPASLNWDEVAWGYNAYSLGIDSRDEFGVFLPYKYIESFGDFKPPVYAYLAVISVKLFGLNEFATRFPAALLGTLTVILTYFLVKEIFPKSNKKEKIALFASLFLAISPWHIMLSRAAFEANVSSFFIILGIFSFLRAINRSMWFLVLSAFSFAISFYTFNTARVFVPMFAIFLGVMFRKELLRNQKQTICATILGLILIVPIVPFLLSPQAKLRFEEVNIFSNPEIIRTSNQMVENDNNALWSRVIHNRRVLYAVEFTKHYFDNLSPSFLFIKGDENPKFSSQDIGEMFLWDIPFLVIGSFILFRKKEGYYFILPIWLLLGIIPAATARETPHALRIETVLPTLQIIAAIGFVFFLEHLSTRLDKKTLLRVTYSLLFLLFVNVFYFLHSYYSHYGRESAKDWNYGYKDAYAYLKDIEGNYDQINFTSDLGRPHMYYLFYNKIDPEFYRNNSSIERDVFGFVHVKRIGKYNFVDKDNVASVGKSIYVGKSDNLPRDITILKEFKLPDENLILTAYVKK